MKTWTPLYSSILNSTIWSESKDVRLLWITMLAMKDMDGFVESSLVGLSKQAGLTFDETKVAIGVLESPDEKSTTHQDHEGRRVKKVDGGWVVLNHLKYRDEMSRMRQRAQQAEWQKKYREKQKAKEEAKKKLGKIPTNGKPSPGETTFKKAVESGASEAEQDRIVEGTLPQREDD